MRDQRDGVVGALPLDEAELTERSHATIEAARHLSLVDLRGDGPLRMGIPSDVARGAAQSLARRWSLAFYGHPSTPDGIIYPSRLNGETNVAIYDRAIAKLRVSLLGPLMKEPGLVGVLREFNVGLV